jgi:hypothetical protein
MGIEIRFFNGARSQSAWDTESPNFVDGWKPEERTVRCESMSMTYAVHLRLHNVIDGEKVIEEVEVVIVDDLLVLDGVFYGDMFVQERGSLALAPESAAATTNLKLGTLLGDVEFDATARVAWASGEKNE